MALAGEVLTDALAVEGVVGRLVRATAGTLRVANGLVAAIRVRRMGPTVTGGGPKGRDGKA